MKRLYMLVGIPASGKSTWAKTQSDKDVVYICLDKIREKLYGDENIQGEWSEINIELTTQLLNAIKDNKVKTVVYDATNVKSKYRKEFLNKWGDNFNEKCAVYFPPDLERSKKWNKQRDRQVPEKVIERMYDNIEKPTKEEGFNVVITLL